METTVLKTKRRARRKTRVRKRIFGTDERPRLTVFRSLRHVYAQLVDDNAGQTIVSASTATSDLRGSTANGGNKDAAAQVGKLLAERALAKGIKQVTFDRNGYRYHGRVKALADAAREAGLKI